MSGYLGRTRLFDETGVRDAWGVIIDAACDRIARRHGIGGKPDLFLEECENAYVARCAIERHNRKHPDRPVSVPLWAQIAEEAYA